MSYLGIPGNHLGKTFDKALEILPPDTDLAAATASDVIDLGDGLVVADLVIDITTTAAEASTITVQFSEDEAFTTPVSGPTITIAKDASGRSIHPFRNDPTGAPLGFMRLMPGEAAVKLGAFVGKL